VGCKRVVRECEKGVYELAERDEAVSEPPHTRLEPPPLYSNVVPPFSGAQTLYKLPVAPCGPDPVVTALRSFSGVRAKRALFAGSVTHQQTTTLVHVLPVDKDNETGDGTGVWVSYLSSGLWLPFSDVVRLLRGPDAEQFAGKELHPETRLFIAQADRWLQETHMHPPSALTIWKTPAPYRTRTVATNRLRDEVGLYQSRLASMKPGRQAGKEERRRRRENEEGGKERRKQREGGAERRKE